MRAGHIVLIASLVGSVSALSIPTEAHAIKEKVRYSFCAQANCADGARPSGGFMEAKRLLYSTSETGGANNGGTVFSFNPKTGAEAVLYSFCAEQDCVDGKLPDARLIEVKGVLYGTTSRGGANDVGEVFAVDLTTGAEKVVHSFGAGIDGGYPYAGVIAVKGKLYGTTFYGGAHESGEVFEIDIKSGTETVLYSFCSQPQCSDGQLPQSGLIDVNGTLYGTTTGGGVVTGTCGDGCGTIFAIDPKNGQERVVYAFCQQQNCADGESSFASLIKENSVLYSTTAGGGTFGLGTVFSLDPATGAETVLYSFGSGTDGSFPQSAPVAVDNVLYGTTTHGGAYNNAGSVYVLDLSTRSEKVLHSFCADENCTDGEFPNGGVIDAKGKLYGTTLVGGGNNSGAAFSIKEQ